MGRSAAVVVASSLLLVLPAPLATHAQRRPDAGLSAARARARELGLGTSKVAHLLLIEPPRPEWVAAAGDPEPADVAGTLRLPVDGAILLRGWGSGRDHYHKALDLGAPAGTPVHAAARGIVAYAGHAVRGYGNIVILIHPNGWVTWYAHHRRNLVVAGQRVERGDVIAQVGETGYAHGTHLHFMLIVDRLHCDAQPLLVPPPRVRKGTAVGAPRVRWTGARPPEIRCAPKPAHPRHHRHRHPRHRHRHPSHHRHHHRPRPPSHPARPRASSR